MSRVLAADMDADLRDRDFLRERWRLLAIKSVEADDIASRKKEARQPFLDALVDEFMHEEPGVSTAKAERMARTCKPYRDYLQEMHDLRKAARLAEIEERDADRRYWELVSMEANERAERRMSR